MKRKIVMGIMGMLLVSFASAGLVDFLSNEITGSVMVNGPIFYTASSNELIMNEEPESGNWNILTSGSYVERQWIMTDDNSLGGIDFYNPEIEFVVELRVDSNFSINEGLGLEFGFYNTNKQRKVIASYSDFTIDDNGIFTFRVPDIAYSEYNLDDVDKFYYSFEPLTSKKFEIKTKNTYVKISGVRV